MSHEQDPLHRNPQSLIDVPSEEMSKARSSKLNPGVVFRAALRKVIRRFVPHYTLEYHIQQAMENRRKMDEQMEAFAASEPRLPPWEEFYAAVEKRRSRIESNSAYEDEVVDNDKPPDSNISYLGTNNGDLSDDILPGNIIPFPPRKK